MRKHNGLASLSNYFCDNIKHKDIIIFGAGEFGKIIVEFLQSNFEKEICFLIDNDIEKQKTGVEINGRHHKVFSISEAIKLLDGNMVIIIASLLYENEMYHELLRYGISNDVFLSDDINMNSANKPDTKDLINDTTIRIFYYKPFLSSNFGDTLNKILIPKLFHCNIKESDEFDCNFISIGSILEVFFGNQHHGNFDKSITVWGSGFIEPRIDLHENFYCKMEFCSVRGNLTKERVCKITNKPAYSDLVVGDPGLLVSRCFDGNIPKKYKYGLIPHFIDFNSPYVGELLKKHGNELILIDVTEKIENIIKMICSCETIISSSLHGLIVADSFGIPNLWVKFSDKIKGGDYKYFDYYSVFGLDNKVSSFDLGQKSLPQNLQNYIRDNYLISDEKVANIQDALYSSFPFFTN